MTRWTAYWTHGATQPRWEAFRRVFLIVVGLDCWLVRLPHVGRYGLDGFNISHVPGPVSSWIPSAALMVVLLAVTGAACVLAGLSSPRLPWLPWAAFGLHTATWAVSLLDSYQHHVFLSVILLAVAWRGRGFALSCYAAAMLYGWASVSKLDPLWREGWVIQRMVPSDWAAGLTPWLPLLAALVLVLEIMAALAYLVRPFGLGSRWLALVVAGLHLGVHTLGLRIGWFGGYMVLLAVFTWWPSGVRFPVLTVRQALGFVLLLGLLAAENSRVVYDYHRFVGHEARRRGDYTRALRAYRWAEAHAPKGESRQRVIRALEAEATPP